MTETIDRDRAVELLRQQVERVGAEYVYQLPANERQCVYFDAAGCPSCIVGYVLADLGVSVGGVHESGRTPGSQFDMGNGIAIAAVDVDGVALTEGARSVLAMAQRAQDQGETWGEALERAVARADSLRMAGVR